MTFLRNFRRRFSRGRRGDHREAETPKKPSKQEMATMIENLQRELTVLEQKHQLSEEMNRRLQGQVERCWCKEEGACKKEVCFESTQTEITTVDVSTQTSETDLCSGGAGGCQLQRVASLHQGEGESQSPSSLCLKEASQSLVGIHPEEKKECISESMEAEEDQSQTPESICQAKNVEDYSQPMAGICQEKAKEEPPIPSSVEDAIEDTTLEHPQVNPTGHQVHVQDSGMISACSAQRLKESAQQNGHDNMQTSCAICQQTASLVDPTQAHTIIESVLAENYWSNHADFHRSLVSEDQVVTMLHPFLRLQYNQHLQCLILEGQLRASASYERVFRSFIGSAVHNLNLHFAGTCTCYYPTTAA